MHARIFSPVALCATLTLSWLAPAVAQAPALLTHHGILESGGAPVSGDVAMTFSIYASPSDDTPLWSEELATVTCFNGYYTVVLGLTTPLDATLLAGASAPELGIAIDGGTDMSPRLKVTSVPYALSSERAGTAALANDLDCVACVDAPEVNFNYAASSSTGGAALDVACSTTCIDSTELANAAVTAAKLAPDAVGASQIIDGAVGTADLADGAVTPAKLANCSSPNQILQWSGGVWACVANVSYTDGPGLTLTGSQFEHADTSSAATIDGSNGSVIQDVAVDTFGHITSMASADLDPRYVNEGQANSITSGMITDGQIGTNDLTDGAVNSLKIADGTVAAADLADNTVTALKIAPGAVGTSELADGNVTSLKIADGTVVTADLADNSVTSAKIVDGTVSSGDILDSTILSADIAADTIAAADIAANAVGASELADNAVDTAAIADANVTLTKLAACPGLSVLHTTGAGAWTCAGSVTIADNGLVGLNQAAPTAGLHLRGSMVTALSGALTGIAGNVTILGAGTLFTTELVVGEPFRVGADTFTVASIADNTHLNVAVAPTTAFSSATAYRGSDLVRIDDGAGTNKLTVDRFGALVFPDGSRQTSAHTNLVYSTVTGTQGWFSQGNAWNELNAGYRVSLTKRTAASLLRIRLTENVGIQTGGYWCALGVAMDGAVPAGCTWAWYYGYNHNSYGVECIVPGAATGAHNFQVWHKSANCYYGNYPWDQDSRMLVVEEIQ